MINILEQVAKASGRFSPSNPKEYMALQVARQLSDVDAVRHYAALFERHDQNRLLDAYQRCAKKNALTGPHFMNIVKALNK
jgi:hypothetical protein